MHQNWHATNYNWPLLTMPLLPIVVVWSLREFGSGGGGVGVQGHVPVIVSEFLEWLDVCAGKEDKAALPLYLNHLGVHARRTTVILRQSTHHVSNDKAPANHAAEVLSWAVASTRLFVNFNNC